MTSIGRFVHPRPSPQFQPGRLYRLDADARPVGPFIDCKVALDLEDDHEEFQRNEVIVRGTMRQQFVLSLPVGLEPCAYLAITGQMPADRAWPKFRFLKPRWRR